MQKTIYRKRREQSQGFMSSLSPTVVFRSGDFYSPLMRDKLEEAFKNIQAQICETLERLMEELFHKRIGLEKCRKWTISRYAVGIIAVAEKFKGTSLVALV